TAGCGTTRFCPGGQFADDRDVLGNRPADRGTRAGGAETRGLRRGSCQESIGRFDSPFWARFRPGPTCGYAAISPDIPGAAQFPITDWKIRNCPIGDWRI